MKLQVISASARDRRAIEPVVSWVTSTAKMHPHITSVAMTELACRRASLPHARHADAYLFVTGERHPGVPSELRTAINGVGGPAALRHKPAGFVGYGAGTSAGARAIERFELIAIQLGLVPLHPSVLVPHVWRAFDSANRPKEVGLIISLAALLGDLVRWSRVLTSARETGQLRANPTLYGAQAGAQAS